jgi:hypothetical protein
MAQAPLSPGGGPAPIVGVRMLAEDVHQLDQLAAQLGVTRSAALRELLHQALAGQATGPPARAGAA